MPRRVNTEVCTATSSGKPLYWKPPTLAYSPSVFSRMTTMSMSPLSMPRRGDVTPGSRMLGRWQTYWSKPRRIGSSRPFRVTWSWMSGCPTAPKRMASNPRRESSALASIILPCSK